MQRRWSNTNQCLKVVFRFFVLVILHLSFYFASIIFPQCYFIFFSARPALLLHRIQMEKKIHLDCLKAFCISFCVSAIRTTLQRSWIFMFHSLHMDSCRETMMQVKKRGKDIQRRTWAGIKLEPLQWGYMVDFYQVSKARHPKILLNFNLVIGYKV